MFKKIFFAFILACIHISLASAFEASYYSDAFEGGTSANGTTFSQVNHTAAICYEDLSQLAYVNTTQTGMVVTLTDRPNCVRHTDRIDLSSSVFSTFAPLSKGLITDISAIPLGIKTGKFVKRNLSQKEFSSTQVELLTAMSNTYFANDSIFIRGKVLDKQKQAVFFLVGKRSGIEIIRAASTDANGYFYFNIIFPNTPDEYYFVLASGKSASTKDATTLFVVKSADIKYPDIPTSQYTLSPKITNESHVLGIKLPDSQWGNMTINQSGKNQYVQGNFLSLSGMNLQKGKAAVKIDGYILSTPSSLDRSTAIPRMYSGVVLVDRLRSTFGVGTVQVKKIGKSAKFNFRVNPGFSVLPDYFVTLPNGDVRKYQIGKKFIDSNGFLRTNINITGSFPAQEKGTYRFEVNHNTGIAYINVPFYTDLTLPVAQPELLTTMSDVYEIKIVHSVNSIRRSLGRKELTLDDDLSRIATLKAKDMYTTTAGSTLGVSHSNSIGDDIRVFAEFYGVTRNIFGENVAGANSADKATILELQDGLEESPGHRHNMISPDFNKVGIGYYQKNGYSYLVHVFSN